MNGTRFEGSRVSDDLSATSRSLDHARCTTRSFEIVSRTRTVYISCIIIIRTRSNDERSFRSEKEHRLIVRKATIDLTHDETKMWRTSRKRISVNLDRADIIVGPTTARSDIRRNVIEGPGECPGPGKCTRREGQLHTRTRRTYLEREPARMCLIQARMQECRRPRTVIPREERTRGTESLEGECKRPLRVPDTRSSGKTLSRLASVRRVCPNEWLLRSSRDARDFRYATRISLHYN